MLVGVDTTVVFADDEEACAASSARQGSIVIIDIGTDPAKPKIVTTLPLMNSVVGPPTDLAITPDGALAIVANSLDWVPDGANWKFVPDNKLYVIEPQRSPPALIDTVSIGERAVRDFRSIAPVISRSSRIVPTTRSACCRSGASR